MAFKVKHHPGALVNCLNTFSHFGINLTKLESRPVPEDPFKYAFIVDFTGTTGEKKVSSCLEFLGNDAFDIKIIGTYSEGLRDFALSEVKSSGPTSHQEKLNNEENSKTDI
jgi:prephenate dehydratase